MSQPPAYPGIACKCPSRCLPSLTCSRPFQTCHVDGILDIRVFSKCQHLYWSGADLFADASSKNSRSSPDRLERVIPFTADPDQPVTRALVISRANLVQTNRGKREGE